MSTCKCLVLTNFSHTSSFVFLLVGSGRGEKCAKVGRGEKYAMVGCGEKCAMVGVW